MTYWSHWPKSRLQNEMLVAQSCLTLCDPVDCQAPLSILGLNKWPAVQTEIWLGEWEVFYKTHLINPTGKVLLLSSSNRGKQLNGKD